MPKLEQIQDVLTYKAASAVRKVILVNPAYTSKMCSGSGSIIKKGLQERIHNCPKCGQIMDRDLNASKTILRRGLRFAAKAWMPATPVVEVVTNRSFALCQANGCFG